MQMTLEVEDLSVRLLEPPKQILSSICANVGPGQILGELHQSVTTRKHDNNVLKLPVTAVAASIKQQQQQHSHNCQLSHTWDDVIIIIIIIMLRRRWHRVTRICDTQRHMPRTVDIVW